MRTGGPGIFSCLSPLSTGLRLISKCFCKIYKTPYALSVQLHSCIGIQDKCFFVRERAGTAYRHLFQVRNNKKLLILTMLHSFSILFKLIKCLIVLVSSKLWYAQTIEQKPVQRCAMNYTRSAYMKT